MEKSLQPLQRQPLIRESVQELIKDYILDNQLRPGDILPPEGSLAEQLAVGRNSVREAVRALEALGMLEIHRGKGIYVKDFSIEPLIDNLSYGMLFDLQELIDIWEVRKVLETSLIEPAIRMLTDAQLADLKAVLGRMEAAAQAGKPFYKEDREFHKCLFRNLNNKVWHQLLDVFWLTFHKAGANSPIVDFEPLETYQDHVTIFDSVVERDTEGAVVALKKHYAGLESRLLKAQGSEG